MKYTLLEGQIDAHLCVSATVGLFNHTGLNQRLLDL